MAVVSEEQRRRRRFRHRRERQGGRRRRRRRRQGKRRRRRRRQRRQDVVTADVVAAVAVVVQPQAAQGAHGLHRPPAADAGEEFRAPEIPERPGPTGTGSQAQPHRHAGQDLVSEPQVRTYLVKLGWALKLESKVKRVGENKSIVVMELCFSGRFPHLIP